MFDIQPNDNTDQIVEKIGNGIRENASRLDELEQKMARGGSGGFSGEYLPSPGPQVIDSEEVKAFTGDAVVPGRRISVQTKAIISALTTNADGSAGARKPSRAPATTRA